MDTLQSYDELPYDRLPFPETEPDFLSALARLHGFAAADARAANPPKTFAVLCDTPAAERLLGSAALPRPAAQDADRDLTVLYWR